MGEPDAKLAARIAVIKQEFLARLKGDWLPNLRTLRQRFLSDPTDEIMRSQLAHAAHDMTGSGAIFGYAEISNIGRRIEDNLRAVIKHDLEDGTGNRQNLVNLIDRLDAVCAAALQDIKAPDSEPHQ